MDLIEIFQKGLLNTVLGMGTVFIVLIFISFIISLFKYIPMLEAKFKKKQDDVPVKVEVATPEVISEEEEIVEEVDDLELVAVITAALTAYLEQDVTVPANGLVVRSIRKVNNSKWRSA